MDNNFEKIFNEINKSDKLIKVLPRDYSIKSKFQINPNSLLGLIIENTGGIVIDNWIRLYGQGEININFRNDLFPYDNLVIGEDIIGGLFVYLENGNIGYFAPDCLEVEDMEISFSQFLYWCLHGDTDTFYMYYRWDNWQKDVSNLKCDEGIAFYPFLWMEAQDRNRKIVPINEIIGLEFDFIKQMKK